MRSRTYAPGIILTAALVTTLAACGSESDGASTEAEPISTQDSATTTEPPPAEEAETTEPPATEEPTTDSTAGESPDEPNEAVTRAPSPPLEEPTQLLVDGVDPLGDGGPPGTPPMEPGRYHSYRLGTEVVFSVPEPFGLGQHGAGNIGWDLDADRVFFLSRWGENEPLTPDEWVAELLDSGWEVVETEADPISGYAVRRFDITPTSQRQTIGGIEASGALNFGDGLPRRVWIIDQDDPQPLVSGTGVSSDEWSDVVDGVVASLEIGPTLDDPRNGRVPLEYGGPFWNATASDQYRTLLFGDTIMGLPVDASGIVSAQFLNIGVPGNFTGTIQPTVYLGAVGQFILPPDDPSAGIFASTLGDPPADPAAFSAFLDSLAERGLISAVRTVDDTVSLLDQTATAVEFDVPNGSEVGAFLSEPDGWTTQELFTFLPASTYRAWTVALDDQVAVVMARADSSDADDLRAATEFAKIVADGFEAP